MHILKTITLFGTVSNPAAGRTSRNGRRYTALGVSVLNKDRNRNFRTTSSPSANRATSPSLSRRVTRVKLEIQAQSQPDDIASIPLLTATFVWPVRPAAM